MKICYIVPWFPSPKQHTPVEQQGIFEYRQVMKLNESGHEFRVISLKWYNQEEYEEVNANVCIYRTPYIFDFSKKIRFPIPNIIKLSYRIKKICDDWNPDLIVYSHAEYLTSLPMLFMKKIKIPKIVAIDTLHGVSWMYGNIIVDFGAYVHSMLCVKPLFKIAEGIHLIGSGLCPYISKLGINLEKTFVITRGVDINIFKPREAKNSLKAELGITPEDTVVLYVGRLDKGKGVEYLLQAARYIISQYTNLKFLIVGDGSLRSTYEKLAEPRTDQILFTGFRVDIPDLMNISDMLVLPSLSEGAANVVMEASASGLPVIASEVGEVPKIIEDSRTGILVKPYDVTGIVNAIRTLVENPALAQEMRKAGRKRMEERYSLDVICLKIEYAYKRIIEHAG